MDKDLCLKAIRHYDETITHLSSTEVRSKYKREGWIKCNDNHIQLLKLERDFFMRELNRLASLEDPYDVKVTRKIKGTH